jgi:ribose transport system ATP-binding protein
MTSFDAPPRLRMAGIEKAFGGVKALRGVDFTLEAGEVHALLGENGSGKSTLMKVAYGAHQPSAGSVEIDGVRQEFHSPRESLAAGVAVVAQELPLVRDMSIAENMLLGRWPTRTPIIDWRATRRQAHDWLLELGFEYDVDQPVSSLAVCDQQLLSIARAVSLGARILILDEPTSALTHQQSERLFETIGRLKERGVGIVYISQRLAEARVVADRVTVLRNGLVVGQMPAAEAHVDAITRMMIGGSVSTAKRARTEPGDVVLKVERATLSPYFRDVSFEVRRGEILGLAGLAGCGRQELLAAIFRGHRGRQGEVFVNGRAPRLRSPNDAVRAGIGMIPADRRHQGLILHDTVQHNLVMRSTCAASLRGVRNSTERAQALVAAAKVGLDVNRLSSLAAMLSGGNQQKVVIGKWLLDPPLILFMDEPTRGVDVGARAEIYDVIRKAADEGLAVVMSSSDGAEVAEISDRVLVMYAGQIVAELDGHDTSEEEITAYSIEGTDAA